MEEYAGEEGQEGEEDAEEEEEDEAEVGEEGEEGPYEEEEGAPHHCAQPLRWLLYSWATSGTCLDWRCICQSYACIE